MNKKVKFIIAGVLLIVLLVYGTGIASQLIYALLSWLGGDAGFGQGLAGIISGVNTEPEPAAQLNIGYPREVFAALLNTPYNLYGLVLVLILSGVIVIFLMKNSAVKGTMDTERNLVYSDKGTYGTAGWMTDEELHKELEVTKDLKHCRGTILGEIGGKAVCVPENTMMNRNVAVYGASGTMKSRSYVRNRILQAVRSNNGKGESLIISDPKSEIYSSMAEYLRDCGYVVKVFNLISPENSDSWNCLREIEGDNPELMAQIFCDVVIRNTLLNGKMDPFWDTGAISLLKALCLYVVKVYPESDRNIGEVYKLLAGVASGGDGGGLKAAFSALPFGHSAKVPFDIFQQASDNVQSGIIIGLANRIQVFQIEVLRTITSHSDGIDLTLPGKQRCAYFLITSDQDSTFDFLSSLFLSFLFIKLVRFADSQPNQKLPVPVHLLCDELANIGTINDLQKKISTIRSRLISMSCVFQNIAQMQNRYPDNAWLEIIGNCDSQLFLGCTDELTAKFISDRTGEVTIGVESMAIEKRAMRLSNYVPTHRETSSIGKRKLLTPDEVLRLPREDALVIFRGQKVLKVKKFDFTKHPDSKKLRDCNARDYIPNWRVTEMLALESEDLADKHVAISAVSEINSLITDFASDVVPTTSQNSPRPVTKAVRRTPVKSAKSTLETAQATRAETRNQEKEPQPAPLPKVDALKGKSESLVNEIPQADSISSPLDDPTKINLLGIEDIGIDDREEPFGLIDIDDLLSGL
ncbi:MAG: type IV secretory system conjugative DNA transfer family protein [Oscillospiraceae bacterium]|nr:type IV secretory system conjugative DNA transfer family protein [Oscillospiraceae bacterium]